MNSKPSTPMKRLTSHFKIMADALHIKYRATKRTLNKAEPKPESPHGDAATKGVESDFIVFFEFGSGKSSISFVFEYLNKNNPEKFFAQIKTGEFNESISTSVAMDFEEFRLKLNAFNKLLTAEESKKDFKKVENGTLVFEQFKSIFLTETYQDSSKESLEIYNTEVNQKSKELKITSVEKKAKQAKSSYEIAVFDARTEYEQIPELEEIAKLENKLRALKEKAAEKYEEIQEAHAVEKYRILDQQATRTLQSKQRELKDFRDDLVASFPPMIRALLRSHN